MIILAALLIVAGLWAAIAGAIVIGSGAYVGWRRDQRRSLVADPYVRPFYSGEYRSPFPWHRAASRLRPVKKDTAA